PVGTAPQRAEIERMHGRVVLDDVNVIQCEAVPERGQAGRNGQHAGDACVPAQSPTAVHHPSVIPYRLSFRYSVDGSIPSTSAARALLPPSACSTHRM